MCGLAQALLTATCNPTPHPPRELAHPPSHLPQPITPLHLPRPHPPSTSHGLSPHISRLLQPHPTPATNGQLPHSHTASSRPARWTNPGSSQRERGTNPDSSQRERGKAKRVEGYEAAACNVGASCHRMQYNRQMPYRNGFSSC